MWVHFGKPSWEHFGLIAIPDHQLTWLDHLALALTPGLLRLSPERINRTPHYCTLSPERGYWGLEQTMFVGCGDCLGAGGDG